MKNRALKRCCPFLWVALLGFLLNACGTTGGSFGVDWGRGGGSRDTKKVKKVGKGPPPHAPAHGYRAKHRYRYYRAAYVYYDVDRKVYFYLQGENWRISASLPHGIHIRYDDYVTIVMDSDKPYTEFKQHKSKYPPGQLKKGKKKKNKKKYS